MPLADDLTFVDATGKVWRQADDLNAHRHGNSGSSGWRIAAAHCSVLAF
jgi:hypothetical protein